MIYPFFNKGASMRAPLLFCLLLAPALLHASTVVDCTHPFNEKTIYWPTGGGFELKKFISRENGIYHAGNTFTAPEHGGTHLDAPSHFVEGAPSVDEIALEQLMGDLAVIDVSQKVGDNADYAVSPKDIEDFEARFGKLTQKNIVVFKTGWERFWPDKEKYLGLIRPIGRIGLISPMHFPGLSPDAAKLLASRKIKAVGLDTASLDPGISKTFEAHRILLGKKIYGLENVANLKNLPPTGARIIVAPMKITGGTGAPVRVLVEMP